MCATKRPTASEIVELLSNNPRLISPCIDVPLASVQVERTDSLELIPSVRKPSGSVSLTNRPVLSATYSARRANGIQFLGTNQKLTSGSLNINDVDNNSSGPYSPMSAIAHAPTGQGTLAFDAKDPLLGNYHQTDSVDGGLDYPSLVSPMGNATPPNGGSSRHQNGGYLNNVHNQSSYVPPGYIILDHTTNGNGNTTEVINSSTATLSNCGDNVASSVASV